ncbi:MAG: twin-arginine translocase subunit TatC [Gemmatimonadota bacterium]
MTRPAGEMPFLDHLEELRFRIIKSAGALVVGILVGFWVVQHLNILVLLKKPIEPYLPAGGKLIVTSPTEPVMIVLKLSFAVGLVLASPLIIYQIWAFLSPALYARERKALIPGLVIGLLLFLTGAALGYIYVVPQTLRVLFSFQSEALAPFISYDNYFGFVLQVVLALGISFELPLVIILLSIFGILTPPMLNRFRRFAVVLACVAGAFLSPGTDVISMVMMTVPLIFLYEVGVAGSVIVNRRKKRRAMNTSTAAVIALFVVFGAGNLQAQVPGLQRPPKGVTRDTVRRLPGDTTGRFAGDTTRGRRAPGQLDSASARRLGLPTGPTRSFPPTDSIIDGLLARPGYQAIRYTADSATLLAKERRIQLRGNGMTQRGQSIMEADSAITYDDDDCMMVASGDPRLFDGSSVVISNRISYNHCTRRAVIADALTNFQEGSTNWFLRGTLAQDSSSSRLYAAGGDITSCDLPVPHYHFSAREVKWISKTVLVARPAVLYVRDVPILWLPFIFQDARPGRRSGILVPQFGINDIVRPNSGYNRQITNIGYYWAPNEYLDVTGRVDWYANRYVQYGVAGQYRWLDRFLTGNIAYSRTSENTGQRTTNFRWDHRQSFNLNTTLNLNVNYVSNGSVLRRNAIDPLLSTQNISSALNFTKRFNWGAVTLGGNRRQSLNDKSVTQTFPAITISPKPLDIARNITWSPAVSFTRDQSLNNPRGFFVVANALGGLDSIAASQDTRVTAFNLDTPLRFGGFNWRNSVRVTDQLQSGRQVVNFREDNPVTPNPTDSVNVTQVFSGDFSTGIDWNTGINLPPLFRSTFKLQPSLGIDNVVGGQPFALRNRNTGGSYVLQGKRLSLSVSSAPTLFAFFPGFGPIGRIRHSISPILSWTYRPEASIPLEFARAIATPGRPIERISHPNQTASIGLSQTFEGKARLAPGDTTDPANVRKYRILSISTGSIAYDFEQAKLPGRTGWTTPSITNTFQSDLLPGFSLNTTHDLWQGQVGTDSARFKPFLSSVSAGFGISGNTFRSLLSIFGLASRPTSGEDPSKIRTQAAQPNRGVDFGRRRSPGFYNTDQYANGNSRSFTANFSYSLSRTRPTPGDSITDPAPRQNLQITTGFSPTPLWSLSWSAQYNITDAKFESHVLRLERDMHEWKASFNVVSNANGNFQFFFSIFLSDLPDIKFDYDQTTIER